MKDFPFTPDWTLNPRLELAFKTKVVESLGNREWRGGMAGGDLRVLRMGFRTFDAVEGAAMMLAITKDRTETFRVPIHPLKRYVVSVAPDAVVLNRVRGFVVGGDAWLWRAWNLYAVYTVEAIDTGTKTLTLSGVDSGPWEAGDVVMPGLRGTFAKPDAAKMQTDDFFDGELTFTEGQLE